MNKCCLGKQKSRHLRCGGGGELFVQKDVLFGSFKHFQFFILEADFYSPTP
jgi:hypothetical protein